MGRKARFAGVRVNALAAGVEVVPVEQHRGQAGREPDADGGEVVVLGLRLQVAEQ